MENLYGWHFPPNLSTYGQSIDRLIVLIHWFMLILFVGWGAFLLYCLIRFRQRPGHKAVPQEKHFRLPKFVEIGVLLFEIFLLVGLSYPIWSKIRTEFPPANQALTIQVVAQQFAWNIHYAGPDGVFGRLDRGLVSDMNPIGLDPNDPAGKDDIITLNQLHFPVNKPVIVQLSTKDVIHSFFIPVLRVKQDAIPGMTIPLWFEANQTGQYELGCAQLCGVGHSLMRGYVTIDTPQGYAAWVAQQEAELAPAAPAAPATQPAGGQAL